MNEKALKYLYGLLKDTRIALGKAERKLNVDPSELDNLRAKIDMLEYSAAAVLAYEEPRHGRFEHVGFLTCKCSECETVFHELPCENFCPNCGVVMNGGEKDGMRNG